MALVFIKSTSNQQLSPNSCKGLFIEFIHALKFNAKLSQGFLEIFPKYIVVVAEKGLASTLSST